MSSCMNNGSCICMQHQGSECGIPSSPEALSMPFKTGLRKAPRDNWITASVALAGFRLSPICLNTGSGDLVEPKLNWYHQILYNILQKVKPQPADYGKIPQKCKQPQVANSSTVFYTIFSRFSTSCYDHQIRPTSGKTTRIFLYSSANEVATLN